MAEMLYVVTQEQIDAIVQRTLSTVREKYDEDSLMTVDEFAAAIGLHPVSVRQMLVDGKIKGFKIENEKRTGKRGKASKVLGRAWRIERRELRNFKERCRNSTAEHLHPGA